MTLTLEKCDSSSNSTDRELSYKDTYWGFNCARCHQQVKLCRPCSRSYRYCKECSVEAREESKRRARMNYERRANGREQHRLRQQRYRERHRNSRETARYDIDYDLSNRQGNPGISYSETSSALESGPSNFDTPFRQDQEVSMPSVTDLSTVISVKQEAIALATERSQKQTAAGLPLIIKSGKLHCDICGALCGPFAVSQRSWRRKRRRRRKRTLSLTITGDQMRISPS
jgi:hypothetical protein